MSSKSGPSQSTGQQLDPAMRSWLFGDATKRGLFGDAYETYKQGPNQFYQGNTVANMNPVQMQAMQGMADFLSGQNGMQGYNATSAAAARMLGNAGVNQPAFQSNGMGIGEAMKSAISYQPQQIGNQAVRQALPQFMPVQNQGKAGGLYQGVANPSQDVATPARTRPVWMNQGSVGKNG